MSSTAHKAIFCLALSLAIGSDVHAGQVQQILSCGHGQAETTALKQAPVKPRRIGEHVLEVRWNKGVQRFVDEPPHDEGGMAGVHWRYCGYSQGAKAHLIEKTDAGLFTGTVLLHDTGRLLPGGHTVIFSPDRKKFLTVEQESGMDGETWAVYTTSGTQLWKGYAGTISKANNVEIVAGTFDSPSWDAGGVLTANRICAATQIRSQTKLLRERGVWTWSGDSRCP